jgi:hypothetical protein
MAGDEMSWVENIAALVLPAFGKSTADATGETGTMRVATTAGSVAHTIPAGMKGRYVDVMVVGANTQYAITTAAQTAPTLVYNQAAAFGTGHAAAGKTLIDSVEKSLYFPADATTITVISSGTAGFFEAAVSGVKK